MIEQVKEFVKSKLEFEPSGHDYLHALRVYENAIQLLVPEVDETVVLVTALIHDLYDYKLDKEFVSSTEEIEYFLKSVGVTKRQILHIFEIIDSMSFSKGTVPNTFEGKIVQDSDRLDALGAIGIARTFSYGGKHHRLIYDPNTVDGVDSVSHFYQKLFLLEDLMNTSLGKKVAHQRTEFMRDFISQMYHEING